VAAINVAPTANPRGGWLGKAKSIGSAAISLVALGLFLAWMGGAFHRKVEPGSTPLERPHVGERDLAKAERVSGAETLTAVGAVQPRRKTDVSSQLTAVIKEIRVRPGDRVKNGDLLVVLDDRELNAQQREASALLSSAEADLATRSADFERVKRLRSSGTASAEEYSRIEGAFRVAEAQARRAKETIARIDVQLTYTRIAATDDDVVSERFADPGDLATPGKPILTVYDPKDLELHVHVPESLASGITLGRNLSVRIDATSWGAEASVREIVPLAQQTSRSVLVKLALPLATSAPLLPGMFGRAEIPVGRAERVLVPQDAVQRIGQLDLVEVAAEDGTLTRRFVRVGRIEGGRAEILSGLDGGERIALPRQ
jgi:membrane fusion protein (multidrug efflux system)